MFHSRPSCGLVDGLRKFDIRMYTLTTHTHPGKISVTHRLELMLSNSPSASTYVRYASQRGMTYVRTQMVPSEIMNTPAILMA